MPTPALLPGAAPPQSIPITQTPSTPHPRSLLPPRYRNPCWQGAEGKLRCLPYFQILGVSKCGTTDLYHRLSKHPDLFESANKGPHFWDECQWPAKGACTVPPNGDFDGYIKLYDNAAKVGC